MIINQDTSTVTKQVKSSSAEYASTEQATFPTEDLPSIEDLPSTPPTFQDEGYGHGVSIHSMIITRLYFDSFHILVIIVLLIQRG